MQLAISINFGNFYNIEHVYFVIDSPLTFINFIQ